MIVVGLISGTSIDGIDVALADLDLVDGEVVMAPRGHRDVAYSADLTAEIAGILPPAGTTLEAVCRIDTRIGQEFAAAAAAAIDDLDGHADLVVSHGQTVFHWVDGGVALGTLQLGQPAWIAERTGLPVVSDVRSADVAGGGHGAPLAATLDVLVLGDRPEPAAALNLGGIANVTVVRPDADPVAFDTGPANALIDAAARMVSGGREQRDDGGRRAARGSIDERLLAALLDDPYYALDPPKSTGRELFHTDHLRDAVARSGSTAIADDDLLATVTALTARTVAGACARFAVAEVVASGGGTHNPTLMAALRDALAPARLVTSTAVGLPVDAKEAHLIALVGFLAWHGLPGTIPACTGARGPRIAGRITPPPGGLGLPPPATAPPTRLRLIPPMAATGPDAPTTRPVTDQP